MRKRRLQFYWISLGVETTAHLLVISFGVKATATLWNYVFDVLKITQDYLLLLKICPAEQFVASAIYSLQSFWREFPLSGHRRVSGKNVNWFTDGNWQTSVLDGLLGDQPTIWWARQDHWLASWFTRYLLHNYKSIAWLADSWLTR